jgi:hypothetical protein
MLPWWWMLALSRTITEFGAGKGFVIGSFSKRYANLMSSIKPN